MLALRSFGVIIPGDPGDAEIRFDNCTARTGAVEHRIGHRGTNGAELTTSIYLFALPDLAGEPVYNASLHFSLLRRSGDFSADPANADIWGLGYVATASINTNWHLLGDTDTRTGADLGTGIGANTVVKLSNNFLTNESNDPNPGSYRLAVAGPQVAGFITLLYSQGAVAGDFAVIRINIDAPTSAAERGFDIASADAVDVATRPTLSINANSTLLYDPFTDGDRTDGADPLDTDWYKVTSNLTLSVVDDSAGIGTGNVLEVVMSTVSRRFLGAFQSVTLTEPGDFVQMSCTFRPTFTFGFDEGFRMGIFSSDGAPLTVDTTVSTDAGHFEGHMVRMSTDSFGDLSTVGVFQGSFLSTPNDFLARFSGALPIATDVVHTLIYTVTRASDTQMTTRVELSKAGTAFVLNGMDPGIDSNPMNQTFYDSFDTIGMGTITDLVDFRVDNVLVQTNVSKVQEHTVVPAADVFQFEVETQPGASYGLEDSTDLTLPVWNETGYLLSGDGSSLRVHAPAPSEPAKFYRLRLQDVPVAIFTEDLPAFNSATNLEGVEVADPATAGCLFGTGNALRLFDFSSANRPELQGELTAPILGPFQISFQACNQSVTPNSTAIHWRMANGGQSITSQMRAAFTLSWHADKKFSASFLGATNTVATLTSTEALSDGVHDIVLVGNGSTTQTFEYALLGGLRTLTPLSYHVYVNGMLFNNPSQFDGGLGFSAAGAASGYVPVEGLKRFGLIGSSSADTDPDVWYDNIFLRTPWYSDGPDINHTSLGQTTGFSFTSKSGGLYMLQSTINISTPFPVWQDTGLSFGGSGGSALLFDPRGFDANKTYRIVEVP